MMYRKNPDVKYRPEKDGFVFYVKKTRTLIKMDRYLFEFWDSFPNYKEFLQSKKLDIDSFEDIVDIFVKHDLLESNLPYINHGSIEYADCANVQLKYPISVCLKITNKCNFRCIHCIQKSGNISRDEMSTNEIFNLVDELERNNIFTLDINGGECLMHPNIKEILSYCKDKQFDTVLSTNASLVDEEMAFFLKKVGVKLVKVSMDSADEKVFDEIRGKGSYKKTIAGINYLIKTGIPVTLQVAISKINFDSIEKIADFAIKMQIEAINYFLVVPAGRAENMYDVMLDKWEYESLLDKIEYIKHIYKGVKIVSDSPLYNVYRQKNKIDEKPSCFCLAGKTGCVIKENGDVTPCPYFDIPIGNIRDNPTMLKKMWNDSELLNNLTKYSMLGDECRKCKYVNGCFGGCRAAAYYMKGEITNKDPYCFLE